MSIKKLFDQIRRDTDVWKTVTHGHEHWLRVEEYGHLVADTNGGDKLTISYFAYLHDCQRLNDFDDPSHGVRAAVYAKQYRGLIDLNNDQFALLLRACSGHTYAMPNGKAGLNNTLAACWDADRLDIGRVGMDVNGKYLFSLIAKEFSSCDIRQ